jgi:hypothetical protein
LALVALGSIIAHYGCTHADGCCNGVGFLIFLGLITSGLKFLPTNRSSGLGMLLEQGNRVRETGKQLATADRGCWANLMRL